MISKFLKEAPERYVTAAVLIAVLCVMLLANMFWLTWIALGVCFIAAVFEAQKLFKAPQSM
ncbi:MAG: hypothetical protein RL154_1676, partial [Pseudomonadota bacterium]